MEQAVKITNSRNLALSAIIHRPDRQGRFPFVIVLHGFTGFKEEESLTAFCQSLLEVGIASVRFDASGFGDSEGSPETDFRVSNYLQDIEDVWLYSQQLPFVDATAIGFCGHSLGGCLALIFTAQNPSVKACCAVQPCTKLTRPGSSLDLQAWRQRGSFERVCDPPLNRHVRLPVEFAEDANEIDALDFVDKIEVPISIIYGERDVDVLPCDTRALFEAARCSKELVALEDVEHSFKRNPEHLRLVSDRLQAFFKQHLLEPAPATLQTTGNSCQSKIC